MNNLPEKVKGKLDVYRAHLLDGEELSPIQEEMLAHYRKAFNFMAEGKNMPISLALLQSETGLSESRCYVIIREALQLFGDITKFNKEGLKSVMYNNFLRLAEKSENALDFRAAVKALECAAKIYDLFENSGSNVDLPKLFQINIAYTTDPAALQPETIDITHTEDNE